MNLKKLSTFMVFMTILSVKPIASHALMSPNEALQGTADSDEESPDTLSRFGADSRAKNTHASVAIPLKPIDESSFEQEVSRGPASVGERGPAMVKTNSKKAKASADVRAPVRQVGKQRAYQEVAVIANEQGFFPATLFLTQGVPVRLYLTGASAKSQCFMLDQFGLRRQVRNQKIEEITFTPDQSGTFVFTCPMNGAKGSLVVKELDLSPRTPASLSVSHSAQAMVPVEEAKPVIENNDE